VAGWTQEALAEKYDISQQRISAIISAVRAQIPETDRVQLIQREVEHLDNMRRAAAELAVMPLPPAFDQKGNPLIDPRTRQPVLDIGGRASAIKLGLDVQKNLRQLLGLDQPLKVDATVSDAAATKAAELAAAAAARMLADQS